MPKKVLVIGSSLREKSNSETPADAFAAGVQSSGKHQLLFARDARLV